MQRSLAVFGSPGKLIAGSAMLFGGYSIYITMVVIVAVFKFILTMQHNLPSSLILMPLALVLAEITGSFSAYLIHQGRRIHLEFETRQLAINCAPVLYLRPFNKDEITSLRPPLNLLGLDMPGLVSEEEQIAAAFRRFGSLLALGRPNEEKRPLGAKRFYSDDENWRDIVLSNVHKASLVVILIGLTGGIWWEIEQIVRLGALDKVIFLVGHEQSEYDSFRLRMNSLLEHCMPELRMRGRGGPYTYIAGVIIFASGSHPVFMPVDHTVNCCARTLLKCAAERVGKGIETSHSRSFMTVQKIGRRLRLALAIVIYCICPLIGCFIIMSY
jgi:hypothetical protein